MLTPGLEVHIVACAHDISMRPETSWIQLVLQRLKVTASVRL